MPLHFLKIYLLWTLFKVFIEFVTVLLLFYVFGFFGLQACATLAPWLGTEPASLALESKVFFNHWTTKMPFVTGVQSKIIPGSRSSFSANSSSTQSSDSGRPNNTCLCLVRDAALSSWQACIGESQHRFLRILSKALSASPGNQFPFEIHLLGFYWILEEHLTLGHDLAIRRKLPIMNWVFSDSSNHRIFF